MAVLVEAVRVARSRVTRSGDRRDARLGSAGAWLTAAQVFGFAVAAYIVALWIALIVWTWRDVEARTADSTTRALSLFAVAAFFIPGLMIYLALRPAETTVDAMNRRLEAEAFVHEIERRPACPSCHRMTDERFVVCPYCRAQLRTLCDDCGASLGMAWVACPYCGRDRQPSVPRAAASARRQAAPVEPRRRPAVQPQT